MAPKFQALATAVLNDRLTISREIAGVDPELVVVFEVRDSIDDFRKAANQISGLEFLAEIEEEGEEPDVGFTAREGALLDNNLYVVAQNAQAIGEVSRLWNLWSANESVRLPDGLAKWKRAFSMLKDVRPWGPADRVQGTQLQEFWQAELSVGRTHVNAEIELWFRGNPAHRDEAQNQLAQQLRIAGCEILDSVQISEISYHALLVRLPAALAVDTLDLRSFIATNGRISTVRPQSVGVAAATVSDDILVNEQTLPPTSEEPLVAVLDGVPLAGHQRLNDRLIVDDPRGLGSIVQASDRNHGTAVSSIVIWGDLERNEAPLRRRVVAHPIFESSRQGSLVTESMPTDRLPVRVMHETLHRLLIGTDDAPAIAPEVKVVVLAAGHTAFPYGARISPWGRLLDVWANRRGILFVVSAGNYTTPIELDTDTSLDILNDPALLQSAVKRHLFEQAHERRILSPGDAMNALTVGALHSDSTNFETPSHSFDVLGESSLPSPISAVGGGFHRQMKPEIFADGGRVLYKQRLGVEDHIHLERLMLTSVSPGPRAASPGSAGEITAEHWFQGTSASAALVGHEAAAVIELLAGGVIPAQHLGIAAKAMIMNTASWSGAAQHVAEALSAEGTQQRRRHASRLLGYGSLRRDRVAVCDERRITVLATGQIRDGRAHEIELPVPPSLNGRTEWRRASMTMTWFSPVNSRHKTYRQARLWFSVENADEFALSRAESDHQAVRRGSTQHEHFDGTRAVTVRDGSALRLRINCAANAGGFDGSVSYAIAVTFEVSALSDIPVYDEVALSLRVRAQAQEAPIRVPSR